MHAKDDARSRSESRRNRGNEIVMRTIDISETSLKNAAMNAIGAARNTKNTAMNAMKAAAEAAAKAALKASVSYKK